MSDPQLGFDFGEPTSTGASESSADASQGNPKPPEPGPRVRKDTPVPRAPTDAVRTSPIPPEDGPPAAPATAGASPATEPATDAESSSTEAATNAEPSSAEPATEADPPATEAATDAEPSATAAPEAWMPSTEPVASGVPDPTLEPGASEERSWTSAPETPERSATIAPPRSRAFPTATGRDINAPHLVRALADVQSRHPLDRKLLVGRTRGEGRELLRQLATRTGKPWVGFEVTTVKPLAIEVAGPTLVREGVTLLDEFDERALADEAIDAVLVGGRQDRFSVLAEGVGFREAVRGAVTALRLAGIGPDSLERARVPDREKRRVLAGILRAYERLLVDRRVADTAGALQRAVRAMEDVPGAGARARHGLHLEDRRVYLLPGLSRRGLAGRFLELLLEHGADLLPSDPVEGRPIPGGIFWRAGLPEGELSFLHAASRAQVGAGTDVELFAATSVNDELREVLRRVTAMDLHWDEVEIVTPDPQVYGSALHALCERLGIPVSFAVGLPVERTRPGRVVDAYFRWLEGDFAADVIRSLLEAGDLASPRPYQGILPVTLARRLRELRVGWGRRRYLLALKARLESLPSLRRSRHETDEQLDRRRDRLRRQLEALRSILGPTLKRTPPVPDRLDTESPPVSPAELATGLKTFLRFAAPGDAVDDTAAERLERILDRVEATLRRRTDYGAAAAILRGHLQIRVPAPRAEGKAPWSSAGGHLYLTDLEHGGVTGRRATFVVGLDATRFPGAGLQDPLLLDDERWSVAKQGLPRSVERIEERVFELGALLARLRGSVTLSYSAWEPSEARAIPPAAELLQAYRLKERDPFKTFEDFHRHVGRPAGPVPGGDALLDSDDVWMGALARDGRLLAGVEVVRGAFPLLDRGLAARAALEGSGLTAHHGQVTPRPEELDPRRNQERVVSASALEALGACPRRYLFRSVLNVHPPDDPVLDPDRWLDAMRRGGLLHRVYERTLSASRAQGLSPQGDAFVALALGILGEEVRAALREVPTPSRAVRDREIEGLRDDVRSFCAMTKARGSGWLALELRFGLGERPPVPLEIQGGTVRVRGAIDRIDEGPDGLVVIDYKTGKSGRFGAASGTWYEGRRLQHYIYSRVAERVLERPVVAMEYHFPTRRGENRTIGYLPRQLATGPELLGTLLDGVAAGAFVATDQADDCKYCDYASICRARIRGWDRVDSPQAEWTGKHLDSEEALTPLRRARRWDEEGEGFWPAR